MLGVAVVYAIILQHHTTLTLKLRINIKKTLLVEYKKSTHSGGRQKTIAYLCLKYPSGREIEAKGRGLRTGQHTFT